MVEKSEVNQPGEHIGTAPHPARNLLLGAAALAAVGLVGLYYWNSARSDASAIKELQDFRQTMADKCKQEQFARPASRQLEGVYADSSRMQAVVHEQLGKLQGQQVDCDPVMKALKSVDFPLE
jgi:hypothetical protein